MALQKTTLYLPMDLQGELRAAARRTGRSQAELIRDALRTYLGSLGRPPLSSLGAGHDPKLRAADASTWVREEWASR